MLCYAVMEVCFKRTYLFSGLEGATISTSPGLAANTFLRTTCIHLAGKTVDIETAFIAYIQDHIIILNQPWVGQGV